jgi:hypothetical protein
MTDHHSRRWITGERREKETFMRRSVEGGWKRSVCSEPRWPPILPHAWFGGGHTEQGHFSQWYLAGCLPYEEFENSKDLGMDHYEVRSFVGWFRHMTLVLLVLAVLTVVCAKERTGSTTSVTEETSQSIPLTVPEVRRLLGRLFFPLPRSVVSVLAWSWWRRCQQARASISHAKRRLNSS